MDRGLFRYSRRTFSGVCFFGAIGLLPFAILRWRAGDALGALLATLLVLPFWGLAAWAYSGRRIGTGPVLLLPLICNVIAFFALWRLRELGIYWFYPLIMAMAYVMPWRWSVPMNITNVIVALVFATSWMPAEHYYRLIGTLLMALVFSSLFSYNNERQQAMLKELLVTDPLTGAFNRRYFERATAEARRLSRRSGQVTSMFMIDIDHFKQINDTFGHGVGDKVLVALSYHILEQLRPMDRFFRLGGEEFALLLPNTTAAQAAQLAERIRRAVADGKLGSDLPRLTISGGIAELPEHGTLESWSDQCDEALYSAKNAGRNKIRIGGAASASADTVSDIDAST